MSDFVPTATIALDEYLKIKKEMDDKEAEIKSLSRKIEKYRKILSQNTKSLVNNEIVGKLVRSIEDGICQPPKVVIEDRYSVSPLIDPSEKSDMQTVIFMFKVKE